MFENLSEKFDKAFKILKGKGKINEINIAESLKEVRKALIDADVSYSIAKEFCNTVKEKALGRDVLTSVEPGQLMVKIVKDELTELMGGESSGLNLNGRPAVVLIAGLQGSGKRLSLPSWQTSSKQRRTKKFSWLQETFTDRLQSTN